MADFDRATAGPRHSLSSACALIRNILRDRNFGDVYFDRRQHFGFQVLHRLRAERDQPSRLKSRASSDGILLNLWTRVPSDAGRPWDHEQALCQF